jgi:2-dehydro-3-deoxyphosphooctonate aldolase (KDO 8-P synthase)
VVFDAGHQVRRSGIPSSDPAGGAPEFIPTLMRAAVAAGANAVFLETHPDPARARCDAASQFPLGQMEKLMLEIRALAELVREQGYA